MVAMKTNRWIMTVAVGFLLTAVTQAEMFLLSAVQDGSGAQSTNTVEVDALAYGHVGAGGQPGGIGTAAGGNWVNSAGFLQAVDIKRPLRDTDGDGIPNELDRDNDNDGLTDMEEVSGSAFGGYAVTDPNVRDADGDGMDDAAEAAGRYDPNDPGHCLKILTVAMADGELALTWIGKGGGTTNEVLASTNLQSGAFTNVVIRAAFAGGSAPWYKTTNMWHGIPGAAGPFYYRVQTSRW